MTWVGIVGIVGTPALGTELSYIPYLIFSVEVLICRSVKMVNVDPNKIGFGRYELRERQ